MYKKIFIAIGIFSLIGFGLFVNWPAATFLFFLLWANNVTQN